jgi:hypothetical protein
MRWPIVVHVFPGNVSMKAGAQALDDVGVFLTTAFDRSAPS